MANRQPFSSASGLANPSQPGMAAFGLGMAALIMAVFGFVWLGWGFSASTAFTDFSSGKAFPAVRWIAFYLAFLALLGASIATLRRATALMKGGAAGRDAFRAQFSKQFRTIVMAEGTGCALAVFLTIHFHRLDLMAAGISLVVGVHFLPLARLLHFPVYYASGAAVVLCDVLSSALLRGDAITLASGAATGAILWSTAIYVLLLSRKFLRQAATA